MNIAVIVFAGRGTRINSSIPKQFIKINNRELVSYTIERFNNHKEIDEIILVTCSDYVEYVKTMVSKYSFNKVKMVVEGGETRQESVRNALNEISANDTDIILIHDGDRPLVSDKIINDSINVLSAADGVCPILKKVDEISEISNSGRVIEIEGELVDIQTPQVFCYKLIKDAHNRLKDETVNDDLSLIEKLGQKVTFINGDKLNFKVTKDCDLSYFEKMVK